MKVTGESEILQQLNNRREFVDRIVANLYYQSPDIEKRISALELEGIIRKVLIDSDIDLPFEYAVIRWNNDTAYHSPGYNPFAEAEYYKVQLFPNEVYANSNYLKLYFPTKQDFLFPVA